MTSLSDLNPPVEPGDVVLDVGCRLTRALREAGHVPPPERVRVVAVFPWGLRIARLDDAADVWDCEHWTRETSTRSAASNPRNLADNELAGDP